MKKIISIIIPCFNEQDNIANIYSKLLKVTNNEDGYIFEYIFVDDGSSDKTWQEIKNVSNNKNVKAIKFSKNFGKEMATTAGIANAIGDGIILIDADGQHPPELIPKFIKLWEDGYHNIIGVRKSNKGEGWIKKYGSKLFYRLFNKWSDSTIVPGSTDFRLIDRLVANEFIALREDDRITRALIDWVGFNKTYVEFKANERTAGVATYSPKKLFTLAINSFVSMSYAPLYFIGYLGLLIMTISIILGIFSTIEDLILKDPLNINITGSAYIGIFILFTVGLVVFTQGLMSIYISKIYKEAKNRPLYIINKNESVNIT